MTPALVAAMHVAWEAISGCRVPARLSAPPGSESLGGAQTLGHGHRQADTKLQSAFTSGDGSCSHRRSDRAAAACRHPAPLPSVLTLPLLRPPPLLLAAWLAGGTAMAT